LTCSVPFVLIARMAHRVRDLLPIIAGVGLLACAACGDPGADGLRTDQIPVAHTPPGGYGDDFPAPVLAGCTEPLVNGAPDLRGMWKSIDVTVNGAPAPSAHPAWRHFQRVEQCGDRVVVTAGGVVHDMRCDGTIENGVDDVLESDKQTRIRVVATYEDGVHVLRPVGVPGVEIRRRRDGADMVWDYLGGTQVRLVRTGPPESAPPSFD
jgi:hypothetical protein